MVSSFLNLGHRVETDSTADQNTAGDGSNSPQTPSKGTSTVTYDLRLTPSPTTLVDANSLSNELMSQMHGTVADSASPEQSAEMGEGMGGLNEEPSTTPLAGDPLVILGQRTLMNYFQYISVSSLTDPEQETSRATRSEVLVSIKAAG